MNDHHRSVFLFYHRGGALSRLLGEALPPARFLLPLRLFFSFFKLPPPALEEDMTVDEADGVTRTSWLCSGVYGTWIRTTSPLVITICCWDRDMDFLVVVEDSTEVFIS